MDQKIGFVGTGQMATALAVGFLNTRVVSAGELFGYDVQKKAMADFAKKTGASPVESVQDLLQVSDIVFLAVKPQQMDPLLREIGTRHRNPLWITIAAGIPMKKYQAELGSSVRLVRVMPNTPCLVGEGVSGYCMSEGTDSSDAELAESLLNTVGIAVRFPESLMDAVVGLSGSGPAYVYMMIDALADGGVKMGIPRDLSLKLAAQTVLGSAKTVLQTGEHPGVLKDRVCSPRGTTIAAVHTLEQNGFRAALIDAVEQATRRSMEMGAE